MAREGRSAIDVSVLGATAAIGLVAGLGAVLACGGGGTEFALAAVIGVAVGLLGGLALGGLMERRRSGQAMLAEEAPQRAAALPGELASPAPSSGASAAAAAQPARAGHLDELVTSIGRRHQRLADRQLGALLTLAGSADASMVPEDLAASTRLARRIRRSAKTLQVLAQDPESQERGERSSMKAVIEMAIADNDHQERIDYQSLHSGHVTGEAVPDLVHLLAELIDNAVAASASNNTKVVVVGRRSDDGYLLSVVDEGGGMPRADRESANQTLQTPPALRQQSPARFGLSTTGRLAARHGIAVTLLEAATDGVIAKVRLPAAVLDTPPGRGRRDQKPVEPARAVDGDVIDLTPRGAAAEVPASAGTEAGPSTMDRLRESLAGFGEPDADAPGSATSLESDGTPAGDTGAAPLERRTGRRQAVTPIRRDLADPAVRLRKQGDRVLEELQRERRAAATESDGGVAEGNR